MYLEQEVYRTLFWAFIIVIVTSAAVISLFYIKTRKRSLLWFGGQLVFLSLSFRFFLPGNHVPSEPGERDVLRRLVVKARSRRSMLGDQYAAYGGRHNWIK